MLNSHCNENGKKICDYRDSNPGRMGYGFKIHAMLRRPMEFTDKNNLYMLKLLIGEWVQCVTRTRVRVMR